MFGPNTFIPFVTAGHPDLETTREIVLSLARRGAGLVEIGIPFSDPIADGPVIQRASHQALRHGYGMGDYVELVREIREQTDIPLIFMTYLNPVLRYGLDRLDREAVEAGLNGILISDLIPEEAGMLAGGKLKRVFLVAPTSSDKRIDHACAAATGFVYLVARTGVTGKQTELSDSLAGIVAKIRKRTDLPIGVGFGIRSRGDLLRVWSFAEGAIVGSAVVAFIEENREAADLPDQVGEWVRATFL